MMTTIGPVVREARQQSRGWIAFLLSTFGGAAFVGAILGWTGSLAHARTALLSATLGVCVAYAVGFVLSGRVFTTDWPPQMPRHWRNPAHPLASVAHYGVVMGLTYATPIRAAAVVPLTLLVLAFGHPLLGAAAFMLLALSRTAPIVLSELGPKAHEYRVERLQAIVSRRALVSNVDLAVVLATLGAVLHAVIVS
jgi:hypothetical protein